jgi:hypothetical protein
MATYAQTADLELYIEGFTVTDAPTAERLLERAERVIDENLGPWMLQTTTGLKIDVATLDANDAAVLKRATVAQAEYELEMGYDFFVRPQFDAVTANGVATRGRAPRLAPRASRELLLFTRRRPGARVGGRRYDVPPWLPFVQNVDDDDDATP